MKKFDSCWSPFIWTDNMQTAVKAIAFYSVALSFVLITLIVHQMNGGDSTQLYNPLFETDVRNSMLFYGAFLIIYLWALVSSAFLMIHGLGKGVRGFMLPWLVIWGIICFFQLLFGVWLLWAYYIYLDSVFIVLCDYLWMGYNVYCWLVVYSMYKVLEEMQSPNIEILLP